MKKTLTLLWMYFKLNLSASMEYRAAFWVQSIGMVINNASYIFLWYVVFDRMGSAIAGYTFRDVMFIGGMGCASLGFANVVFGNCVHISRMILESDLDTYLTQPSGVLLSMLCSRTDLAAWGNLAYGFLIFFITGQSLSTLPLFLLFVVTGGLLMVFTCVLAHTMTFYVGDASFLGSMAIDFIICFSVYPIGIYPVAIRALMSAVIPAVFVSHVPLAIIKEGNTALLLLLLGFTVAYCTLSAWFFGRGLRRYESGNQISARL